MVERDGLLVTLSCWCSGVAGLIWINFEAAAAASINRSSGYIGGIQGERAPVFGMAASPSVLE